MTIGLSCLLHLGLVTGLILGQRWEVITVPVPPPVMPVRLVTLDTPAEPRRELPVPPSVVRRKAPPPPRVIEPPKLKRAGPPRPRPIAPEASPTASSAPAMSGPPTAEPIPTPGPPAFAPAPSIRSGGSPAVEPVPTPVPAPTAIGPPIDTPVPPSAEPVPAPAPPAFALAPSIGPSGPPTSNTRAQGTETARPSTGIPEGLTRYARPRGGYQVQPTYPPAPRRLGIQGTTLLRVRILADGRIGEVLVEKSAGHPDLDEAAADAVRHWRFDPARRGTEAVALWVLLPVEFRLR
jgi:protein TonB